MAEQHALQAFAAVPKLIMALLEFIMKMRDLTAKTMKSKLDNLNQQLEDNKKLSEADKKELQSKITTLEDELGKYEAKSEEYREAIANGTIPPDIAQSINDVLQEMHADKDVEKRCFNAQGELTDDGATEFIQRCTKKNLGLQIDKSNAREMIDRAKKTAEQQKPTTEVNFLGKGEQPKTKPESGIEFS